MDRQNVRGVIFADRAFRAMFGKGEGQLRIPTIDAMYEMNLESAACELAARLLRFAESSGAESQVSQWAGIAADYAETATDRSET